MQGHSARQHAPAFRAVLPLIALCFWPSTHSAAQPFDPIYLVDSSITCGGEATDINDAGEVTGSYSLLGSCFYPKAFYWTEASGLEDIAAGCGERQRSIRINASGHVLGVCAIGGTSPSKRVPFVWSRADSLTILRLDDGNVCGIEDSVVPVDINDSGEIVGYCQRRTSPYTSSPFHWSPLAGGTNLGTFGATAAYPMDINNIGDVLIVSTDAGQYLPLVWNSTAQSGRFLETTENYAMVYEINDLGQVAGVNGNRASVWGADGSLIDIHPAGYSYRSSANSINNAGQVAGSVRTDTTQRYNHEAFVWSETDGLQFIGDAGTELAIACGFQPVYVGPINDDGILVGTRRTMLTGDCEGTFLNTTYYWSADHGMVDLMATGAIDGFTHTLNNSGQIAGSYDGLPVLWTIPSGPMTPDEEIEIVKDIIDDLVASGSLNIGQGTSLNSKLDAAAGKIGDGHVTPGCNILDALVGEIRAKMNSGELSQSEGNAVIAAANEVSACSN